MMATVPHVTSGLGLRKYQADGFLLTRVYHLSTAQIKPFRRSSTYCATESHYCRFSIKYLSRSALARGPENFFTAGPGPAVGDPAF